FAVAHQHVYKTVVFIELFCLGGANGYRQPLSEGTRRNANTGEMFVRSGVSLESGIYLTESSKFFSIKIAGTGEGGVPHRGNVPVGKEKQIFTRTFHVEFRIMLHDMEIQGYKILGTAQ